MWHSARFYFRRAASSSDEDADDLTSVGRGGSLVLSVPILVKATYEVMQRATKLACDEYRELTAKGDDPEIVLGKGREDPKFGHHSLCNRYGSPHTGGGRSTLGHHFDVPPGDSPQLCEDRGGTARSSVILG